MDQVKGYYMVYSIITIICVCVVISTSAATCPADFLAHPTNGLCYGHVISPPRDFREAELDCRSRGEGGTLVRITDVTLKDWITDNVLPADATSNQLHYWVGMNDIENNGKYSYNDGSPITYFFWDTVGHGDAVTEGCIRGKAHYSYKVSDTDCKNEQEYICEVKQGGLPALLKQMRLVVNPDATTLRWSILETVMADSKLQCAMLCLDGTSGCAAVMTETIASPSTKVQCSLLLPKPSGPNLSVPSGATLYEWVVA